jgi:hypothetical protein
MTQQADTGPTVTGNPAPDFEAAVAAAVDARMEAFFERIAKQQGAAPAAEGDAQTLFRQMALAIAEISDQGSNRKRVAPEVLAARAKAHERMVEAILEAKRAHEEGRAERPKYRAIGKMYLNERFIEPFVVDPVTKRPRSVEFRWSGVPNEVMRPLNKPAEEIFKHYLASLGSVVKEDVATPMWITAGGLVIEGEGPISKSGRKRSGQDFGDFGEDLEVDQPNASDPTKPWINVLGTVAAPARQNMADIAKRA